MAEQLPEFTGTATCIEVDLPYDKRAEGGNERKSWRFTTDEQDGVPDKLFANKEKFFLLIKAGGTYEFKWVLFGDYNTAYLNGAKQVGFVAGMEESTTSGGSSSPKPGPTARKRELSIQVLAHQKVACPPLKANATLEDVKNQVISLHLMHDMLVEGFLKAEEEPEPEAETEQGGGSEYNPNYAATAEQSTEAEARPEPGDDDIPF